MKSCPKAVLTVLALALSSAPNFAQGGPQGAGKQGSRDDFAMRGPADPPGPMRRGERPGWGRMRGGFDGRGRFGGRGRFDGGGSRGQGLLRALGDPDIRKQIGVTDEQFAKIRQQQSDFRKTEIRDRADLQVKRIDLRDLLSADKPDRSAIDSKLSEIGASQLALQKSAVDFNLSMRDAITPAQRDKLRELLRQRAASRGAGFQPGRQRAGRQSGGPGGPAPQRQPAPPPTNN